jgi:hypothetical protein
VPQAPHLGSLGHIKQGHSITEFIEAGKRFGNNLYVHLPSNNSFSRRIKPLFSSFKDILEPSRLLALSMRHKSA